MPRRPAPALTGALVGLAALAALACTSLPPRLRECPGPLRPTQEIAGDFTRYERIRVRGRRVDESFGLVLQKTGDRLVVLATNAFGAKAFAVTQRGAQVETKSFLGRALVVPPENVLRDLHFAYFLTDEQRIASKRKAATRTPTGVTVLACNYEATIVPVSEQREAE